MFSGRILKADEAERIGWIDRMVRSKKSLEAEVNKLAETIASKSSLIQRILKKTINNGLNTDLPSGLACEKANFALCFDTEDIREGIDAFRNKRKAAIFRQITREELNL